MRLDTPDAHLVVADVGMPWELFVVSVLVILARSVSFRFDSYFREYREHTDSPAIPVGERGVM